MKLLWYIAALLIVYLIGANIYWVFKVISIGEEIERCVNRL